jgi:imidazolonepropionase
VDDGRLLAVGEEAVVSEDPRAQAAEKIVNCQGACLVPGLVDPHTHMCFTELREQEFALRLAGTPYLEILKQGGGILSSVKAVREAEPEQLVETTRRHVLTALALGTTTLEIKSGYGLDTPSELKMLAAIDAVAKQTPLDVVATFLGAHAIPAEYRRDPDGFVTLVVDEMLPAVVEQGIARFCDVFCEEGVFSPDQSRRILMAAKQLGLGLKIHADEVHDLGGGGLAADLRAVSADHLLAVSDANVERLARSGTVAVLLPATAYSLRKPYARARHLIAAGLPVALATDCNPGSSYTESMPFAMGLAVVNMEMTPAEALVAATLNAAYAIGMNQQVGSLDVEKQADFLLLEGQTPAILSYHAGVSSVRQVYKQGRLVHEKTVSYRQ